MKRLLLFCAVSGVLLSSATPVPLSGADGAVPQASASDCETGLTCVEDPPFDQSYALRPPVPAAAPVANQPIQSAEAGPALPPPPAAPVEPPPPGEGVRIVVSIPEQELYVFKNGDLVATSPVSTGKRGHSTPAGTFRILQKKVHHRSNLYDNAPMPYMQRLTWGGVALHAGKVPGYPASHGCIRLPRKFAKTLYGMTNFDTWVTVTKERPASADEALDLA